MKGRDLPVNLQALSQASRLASNVSCYHGYPHCGTTVSGVPLSIARSMASQLRPKNGWERDSTSMGPRYIVRHIDDQRGYYLLCNMVTLQSRRVYTV